VSRWEEGGEVGKPASSRRVAGSVFFFLQNRLGEHGGGGRGREVPASQRGGKTLFAPHLNRKEGGTWDQQETKESEKKKTGSTIRTTGEIEGVVEPLLLLPGSQEVRG